MTQKLSNQDKRLCTEYTNCALYEFVYVGKNMSSEANSIMTGGYVKDIDDLGMAERETDPIIYRFRQKRRLRL